MSILGVILAGGLSTRMNGHDKALIKLSGYPLIEHSINRLESQVDGLAININRDYNLYKKYNLPIIPDTIDGFLGPLAGILAGMDYAAKHKYTHVITVAADTPFFPLDLNDTLFDENFDINIAKTISDINQKNLHPTFGLWNVKLRDELRAALIGDVRKVMLFVKQNKWRSVGWEKKDYDQFFNVNTPEDMINAELIENGKIV